jgi:hypothetical protein
MSGVELSCSGRGSSFAGEEAFLGAGEDAGTGEVVWLAAGISRRAAAAGLSTLGLALELEACSDARGALEKEKSKLVKQKKSPRSIVRGRKLP